MAFEVQVAEALAAAGAACLLTLFVLLKFTGPPRSTTEATTVLTLLGLGAYSIATSLFIVLFTIAGAVWP